MVKMERVYDVFQNLKLDLSQNDQTSSNHFSRSQKAKTIKSASSFKSHKSLFARKSPSIMRRTLKSKKLTALMDENQEEESLIPFSNSKGEILGEIPHHHSPKFIIKLRNEFKDLKMKTVNTDQLCLT